MPDSSGSSSFNPQGFRLPPTFQTEITQQPPEKAVKFVNVFDKARFQAPRLDAHLECIPQSNIGSVRQRSWRFDLNCPTACR